MDIEHYRTQFQEYLRHTQMYKKAEDKVICNFIKYVEQYLLSFLQQNCRSSYFCIYEYQDKDELDKLSVDLLPNGNLENIINRSEIRTALMFYIGFVESSDYPLSEKQLHKKKTKSVSKEKIKQGTNQKKTYLEGALLQERDRIIHQRNPNARMECIEAYGNEYKCVVCGMNFVETYGELGKDFIEVHHLFPISEIDGEHEIDPVKDMIPLCSNCHSMIHRQEDPSDWKSLRDIYLQKRNHTNQ